VCVCAFILTYKLFEGLKTYETLVENQICEACTTCTQPHFQVTPCNVQEDTGCATCTVCDFRTHIETHSCNDNSTDAECEVINFWHSCASGSVAGNNTCFLQLHCFACQVRLSINPADRWFEFVSPCSAYANVHSCDVRCLGFSRLRDISNSRGCWNCETGNVLEGL